MATVQELTRVISAHSRDAWGPCITRSLNIRRELVRLDLMFDPLRNDPRFQKLAAPPAPEKP
jgi:hypothetical protein